LDVFLGVLEVRYLVGASPYTISRPKWGHAPMTLGVLLPYGALCAEVESVQAKQRRNPMSHNVVPPLKDPAPPAEVMTLWKHVKHLGTLLTTEEIFNADGTSKRLRRVRRSIRM
jgi:hypothetical protein